MVWLARSDSAVLRAVKIVQETKDQACSSLEREFRGVKHYASLSQRETEAPGRNSLIAVLHVEYDPIARILAYAMELADPLENWADGSCPYDYRPRTLKSVLQKGTSLSAHECLALAIRLAEGLAFLHRHHLLHRDVKPSNIIFVRGQACLADIGFISAAGEARSVVGTLHYFPPEGGGTEMADLFALGKVIYETIARKPAAEFPRVPQDLADRPDRLLALELMEIAGRAAAARLADRYRDTTALLADLRLVAGGGSVRTLRRNERWLRDFRRAAILLIIVATLLGAFLVRETRQRHRVAALERESRTRLVELHLSNGTREMEAGNFPLAALWFTEALKTSRDPQQIEMLRWRLGAVISLGPSLLAAGSHQGPISEVALSPDGKLVLTASEDHTARLWRSENGEPVGRPMRHTRAVNDASFSPDGCLVLTGGEDGIARLWFAGNGAPTGTEFMHGAEVVHAEFSPDGNRVLTAGKDGFCRVWRTNGIESCPPLDQGGEIQWAAFSPDGTKIASASWNNTACLWDAGSGRRLADPIHHADRVEYVSFSPDGARIITACKDGTAQVWDSSTGKPAGPSIHHVKLDYAGFSAEGSAILTSGGRVGGPGEVQVWDSLTGREIGSPVRHNDRVRYAAFSPDGIHLASASRDGVVQITDAKLGGTGLIIPHGGSIWSLAFSRDGKRLLTGGYEGVWRLWDIFQNERTVPGARGERWDSALCDLAGETLWVQSDFKPLRAYSLPALEEKPVRMDREVQAHLPDALSPERFLVAFKGSDYLTFEGSQIAALINPTTESSLTSLLHPAWTAVLYGTEGLSIRSSTRQYEFPFSQGAGPVQRICLVENRLMMILGDIFEVRDLTSGRLLVERQLPIGECRWFNFDATGRLLAFSHAMGIGTNDEVRVWDTLNPNVVKPTLRHNGGVARPAFSPDGKLIATASEVGEVFVWDVERGSVLYGPFQHELGTFKFAFSADSKRLAAGSWYGTIRMWDLESGAILTPPIQNRGCVSGLQFIDEGSKLLIVSEDGGPRVLSLPKLEKDANQIENAVILAAGARLDKNTQLKPLRPSEVSRRTGKRPN